MNRGGRIMAHVADHLSIVELEERYRSCNPQTKCSTQAAADGGEMKRQDRRARNARPTLPASGGGDGTEAFDMKPAKDAR
jgi:hypothetical protein